MKRISFFLNISLGDFKGFFLALLFLSSVLVLSPRVWANSSGPVSSCGNFFGHALQIKDIRLTEGNKIKISGELEVRASSQKFEEQESLAQPSQNLAHPNQNSITHPSKNSDNLAQASTASSSQNTGLAQEKSSPVEHGIQVTDVGLTDGNTIKISGGLELKAGPQGFELLASPLQNTNNTNPNLQTQNPNHSVNIPLSRASSQQKATESNESSPYKSSFEIGHDFKITGVGLSQGGKIKADFELEVEATGLSVSGLLPLPQNSYRDRRMTRDFNRMAPSSQKPDKRQQVLNSSPLLRQMTSGNTDIRLSPASAQKAGINSKDLNQKNSAPKKTSRSRRAVQREFGFWDSIKWMIQKSFFSREPEKDSPKLSSSKGNPAFSQSSQAKQTNPLLKAKSSSSQAVQGEQTKHVDSQFLQREQNKPFQETQTLPSSQTQTSSADSQNTKAPAIPQNEKNSSSSQTGTQLIVSQNPLPQNRGIFSNTTINQTSGVKIGGIFFDNRINRPRGNRGDNNSSTPAKPKKLSPAKKLWQELKKESTDYSNVGHLRSLIQWEVAREDFKINLVVENGMTLLQQLVKQDYFFSLVEILLKNGANINTKTRSGPHAGKSAWDIARENVEPLYNIPPNQQTPEMKNQFYVLNLLQLVRNGELEIFTANNLHKAQRGYGNQFYNTKDGIRSPRKTPIKY